MYINLDLEEEKDELMKDVVVVIPQTRAEEFVQDSSRGSRVKVEEQEKVMIEKEMKPEDEEDEDKEGDEVPEAKHQ
jgi:hypothetical protein